MKRAILAKSLVAVSLFVMSASALAQRASQAPAPGSQGTAFGAPEISPSLLVAGAMLLIGGTLILLSNRRQRQARI